MSTLIEAIDKRRRSLDAPLMPTLCYNRFRPAVLATLAMLVALASYYLCYARFNLKLSPEELISIDAEVAIQILGAPSHIRLGRMSC